MTAPSADPWRPQVFDSPDAWIGREMAERSDWRIALSADDVAELLSACRSARAKQADALAWRRDDFSLPTLGAKIEAWRAELGAGRGFVLIKGFPVKDHPLEVNRAVYWGIGLHLGRAVSQNTQRDLLGDVRDTGADPDAYGVRLYRTRAEQDFHTDGADIIGLFCLNGARSGGVSRIVSSVTIFNQMVKRRPDLVPTLLEPFPFDTQGQHRPGEAPWFDWPIARLVGGRPHMFFIPWYIRESQQHEAAPRLSRAQEEVVAFIETTANEPDLYLDMNFEPGDMQFLRNASILHKRTAFEDWPEPERKRHLLRLWLAEGGA